jgi:oligopeptide transport system substrate-binding protein
MNLWNQSFLVTVLFATVLGGFGCKTEPHSCCANKKGKAVARPTDQSTLRVAMFEAKSIDPGKIDEGMGRRVAEELFEGLLTRSASGKSIPGSAVSWKESADHLTYTFQIRPDLVWSDGVAITARDFEWSMRRALAPETGNRRASLLYPIRNAAAYNKGVIADVGKVGVHATASHVLAITLERPYPLLPQLLTGVESAPAPKHVIEEHGNQWTRPQHIVSNGPYLLSSHKAGQDMVLTRNPRYWDVAHMSLDRVRLRFTTQSKTAYDWYRLNEVDVVFDLVPTEVLKEKGANREAGLRIDSYDGVFYLLVNTTSPPLNDPLVRRAIDLSIDRARLTRQVLGSGELPAVTFIPPGMTSARPARRIHYDPDRAKTLLAEAGYGSTKTLPSITLSFNTNPRNRMVAVFLQRHFKEHLGLTLNVENMEWKTYLDRINAKEYQLGHLVIGGGIDPMEYFTLLEGDSNENRTNWKHDEFDTLAEKARAATSLRERDEAIAKAMAIADRQMPMIPVWVLTRKALVRPGLIGYVQSPENLHPLRWLHWE